MTTLASSTNDIVCITETWLNNSIPNGEVVDCTYLLFRRDKDFLPNQKQRGGRVFIAIKKRFQADQVQVSHQDIEQIYIKVKLDQEDLIIGNVYIPPNSEASVYERHIQDVVNIANRFPGCRIVLLGVYNIPDVKWRKNNEEEEFFGDSVTAGMVLEECSLLGLMQINRTQNCDGKFLDLCFTNCDISSHRITPMVPEDKYHPVLEMEIIKVNLLKPRIIEYLDFRNGDYGALNNFYLRKNWIPMYELQDIESIVDYFYKFIQKGIDTFIPRAV